jgi:hypothetical protein
MCGVAGAVFCVALPLALATVALGTMTAAFEGGRWLVQHPVTSALLIITITTTMHKSPPLIEVNATNVDL